MATMYRSTDTGAPTLEPRTNYNNAKVLMQIIKACLVDGYGDKSGAGWTVAYEDTTPNKHRVALSNGNGVIEFVTWGATGVGVFIWDEITSPGSGRLYDDPWGTVVSSGVNGFSADGHSMPGTSSNMVVDINTNYFAADYASNTGWTIFADARSCWLSIHHPEGNTASEAGKPLTIDSNLHGNLFFGAVKSADLEPDQIGNFFLLYGAAHIASGSSGAGSHSANLCFGLRTPTGLTPGNNIAVRDVEAAWRDDNPFSSVRILTPIALTYDGSDKPVPAGLSASYDDYTFATIPGIAKFARSNTGFWGYYTAIYGETWNRETVQVNGALWVPHKYSSSTNNEGLTTDERWWT